MAAIPIRWGRRVFIMVVVSMWRASHGSCFGVENSTLRTDTAKCIPDRLNIHLPGKGLTQDAGLIAMGAVGMAGGMEIGMMEEIDLAFGEAKGGGKWR
jgi:hypothetical protein